MGSTILVIWQREWFTAADELELESSSDDARTEITVVPETPPPESLDSDSDTMQEASAPLSARNRTTYHTVTFKCIWCHKEVQYLLALASASQLRSNCELVLCRLECEPNNPYDAMQ